jgi:hypothetical protein
MRQTVSKRFGFSIKDFIPAFSGLIGKISLISSFALVWAQELDITASNFVFENIRVEIIIGGAITLAAALLRPNTAPAGTLAPLIVLIPTMASFGVHPLVLSILVGIIGIVTVKTRLFTKLLHLSGRVSKASLALAFGVSGIVLCVSKLLSFSEGHRFALALLMAFLSLSYFFS